MVIVAGGINEFDSFPTTTELLFLDDNFIYPEGGWESGPELLRSSYAPIMVEFQGSVILVGGTRGEDGRHLYQLDSPQGQWKKLNQTLKERRSQHVSFLIPDELTDCS